MDIKDRRPYPVPVEASKGPAGTSVSPGWKIVILAVTAADDLRPFLVRENDIHHY